MYDSGKIILGLLIFAAVFTTPLWLNLANSAATDAPVIELPTEHKECVMDTEYMKAYHMDLLDEWRDKVVREDKRFFNFNGEMLEMSLSKTCMKCHDTKEKFCDRCHDYLGVVPYCWSCHITPEEVSNKRLQMLPEGNDITAPSGTFHEIKEARQEDTSKIKEVK